MNWRKSVSVVVVCLLCVSVVWAEVLSKPDSKSSLPSARMRGLNERKQAQDEVVVDEWGCSPYIVQLVDPPLAGYRGGLRGLRATSPEVTGERKLDVNSRAALDYRAHLEVARDLTRDAMENELRRTVKPMREFFAAINGMVVWLTPEEAELVAELPGVLRVERERYEQLDTDAGPAWIGAPSLWYGDYIPGPTPTLGAELVVGVLDTGINPLNPSFAEVGGDGYIHTNPRGQYYGTGDPANTEHYDPDFPLNNKLIGAYDLYTGIQNLGGDLDPTDVQGHGSHVAGTIAGNVINPATLVAPTTTLEVPISGVAPHANIISYRVCQAGCPTTSTLAGVEQAIIDGVDVINYSISMGGTPWDSLQSLAFASARAAGIFVASSAGNDGPGLETVSVAKGPWMLTVGSSTHNRMVVNEVGDFMVSDGSPLANIKGQSFTSGYGPALIVYAGDYENPNDPEYPPELAFRPFPPGTFPEGAIVVAQRAVTARIAIGAHVQAGGAGGLVLINNLEHQDSLNTDPHVLPAVHIGYEDGLALLDWLRVGTGHSATIKGVRVEHEEGYGDRMSSFSSRGPNPITPQLVLPNVVAPGSNIIAPDGQDGIVRWGFMSGTSMASPHAAGAGLLLMAQHPDWTMAEIQSALMSTAVTTVKKEDGLIPATLFDQGNGRIDVSAATRAGVVLDEQIHIMLGHNPSEGGNPAVLNLASLGAQAISQVEWERAIRSVADHPVTWTVTIDEPPHTHITVSDPLFVLEPDEVKVLNFTAVLQSFDEPWGFGQVSFVPDSTDVVSQHFPIQINQSSNIGIPSLLEAADAMLVGSTTIEDVRAIEITEWTTNILGPSAGVPYLRYVYQDPFNNSEIPINPKPRDGSVAIRFEVEEDTEVLIIDIYETTSHDLDLFLFNPQDDYTRIALSTREGNDDGIVLFQPPTGELLLIVQNYEASDWTGQTPDSVLILITELNSTDSEGTLTVRPSEGQTSILPDTPFDLEVSWDIPRLHSRYYGYAMLASDPTKLDNVGSFLISLTMAGQENPVIEWSCSDTEGAAPLEVSFQVLVTSPAIPLEMSLWNFYQQGYYETISRVTGHEFGEFRRFTYHEPGTYYAGYTAMTQSGAVAGVMEEIVVWTPTPTDASYIDLIEAIVHDENHDGMLQPGECAALELVFQNIGMNLAPDVVMLVESLTPGVEIVSGSDTMVLGDIPVGATVTNPLPIQICAEYSIPCPLTARLAIEVSSAHRQQSFELDVLVGSVLATYMYEVTESVPIPDNDPNGVYLPLTVSGVEGSIFQVEPSVHILHTWIGDLVITLLAPDGTTAVLGSQQGGNNDNYGEGCPAHELGTTFADTNALPFYQGRSPFVDRYYPVDSLTVFRGLAGDDVNGEWRLHVADLQQYDTGTFECWSLSIKTSDCSVLQTPTPTDSTPTETPAGTETPLSTPVGTETPVWTPTPVWIETPIATETPVETETPVVGTETPTPVPTEPWQQFDFTGDLFVGPQDLLIFKQHWHQGTPRP